VYGVEVTAIAIAVPEMQGNTMKPTRRQFLHLAAGAAALPTVSRNAAAQTYPSRLVKMILPYTAGSPNDVLARIVAPALSSRLGQPIIIDNRPGGSTLIGTRDVMTAKADGYTLLWSNSPVHFIAPFVSKGFKYDPLKDFVPIASIGSTSQVLVIVPSIPAKTLPEFIAYAKANPGKVDFGFGRGTNPHLIGALFQQETGTEFAFIPYKGGAQVIPDMLGGRIHMNFGTASTLLQLIRNGSLRALAVTSAARSRNLPEVPTMIESGYPKMTSAIYYGILGPAGLPDNVVSRINDIANEIVKSPELIATMAKVGFEPISGSPQDFSNLIATEMQKWLPIVKTTGFEME
jgi:tripartite-type tricarboxylate transporter receptor subunit TctC